MGTSGRLRQSELLNGVVIIPVFNRPEFLKICLEYIRQSDNYKDYLYLFAIDFGYSIENLQIIKDFEAEKELHFTKEHQINAKLSYNLLNAYSLATKLTEKIIILIEDDILVSKGFFKWHQEIHEKEKNIFCAIASKNDNTNFGTFDNPNFYYISQNADYQSLGTSFKSEKVKEFLTYATEKYFADTGLFCKTNFPQSKINKHHTEQAGLIRRVIEKNNYHVVFAHVPFCTHVGFYGKNNKTDKPYNYLQLKYIFQNETLFNNLVKNLWQLINFENDFTTLEKKNVEAIEEKYKFSVIIASYLGDYPNAATNREEKFIRAVNSVLQQTLQSFEIVIISDGCEKTRQIYLDKYSKFVNIKCLVISKQRLFSGKVRQTGIENASGKYICYLDTDDYFENNHLEKINENIKNFDWIFFNDNLNQMSITAGNITTSGICHKQNMKVTWADGYGHDLKFSKELQKISNNFKHIGTAGYIVCHVPKTLDL